MADVANKYAENVPGKFYVDDQCIDCDLCRETGAANFKRNDDGAIPMSINSRRRQRKKALCKEAMEAVRSRRLGMMARSPIAAVCHRRIPWASNTIGASQGAATVPVALTIADRTAALALAFRPT